MERARPGAPPPATTSPPCARRAPTWACTRSAASGRDQRADGGGGVPGRARPPGRGPRPPAARPGRRAARGRRGSASTAEHACPFIIRRPKASSSATRSRSASSSTRQALLPPSSRCSGRSSGAEASATLTPAAVDPVSETASTRGSATRRAPGLAAAVHQRQDVLGRAGLQQGGVDPRHDQRVLDRRLGHHRVAAHQRGRALLHEQLRGEVEGDDRRHHAERLAPGEGQVALGARGCPRWAAPARRSAAPRPRWPAAAGWRRATSPPRLGDRLARLGREQVGERLVVGLQQVGRQLQHRGALGDWPLGPGRRGGGGPRDGVVQRPRVPPGAPRRGARAPRGRGSPALRRSLS